MGTADRNFRDAGRLSHLLWETSARASALSEQALADTPLSSASSGVLDAIAAKPGTSIADLARWLPTSAQGISQIVARLERLGFVERRLGARGFGVALHPTREGDQARRDADGRIERLDRQFARALGPADHAALISLLDRARVALERFAEVQDP